MAQAGTVPPGFETTESSGSSAYSFYLGRYANMRFQTANGDLTSKGPKVFSEISFRQDGSVSSSLSVGRSWTQVVVMMAETKVSSMSSTWTKNHLTKPTTVYSAKHSWPDLTKQPSGAPNPWDNGGLKFPFTSKFAYTGVNDLLLDMIMRGGALANAAAWGTSSTGSSPSKSYYLDGRTVVTSTQGSLSVYGLNSKCTFDSGNTSTSSLGGGYGYWVAFTENSPSNRFRHWVYRTYMPKSANFVHALSLGGTSSTTKPGPVPGLGCQALQIDTTKIFLVQTFKTTSSGFYSQPTQYTPYIASAVGLIIWAQGIWNDTVTSHAKLTRTSRLTVRALPPKADFNGKRAYRYAPKTGVIPTSGFTPSPSNVPVYRYK
ncbi:MAG: hypothetical protein ACYTF5_09050 [Planctomycetota bacterium]|jgi:hypothetical protein